MGRRFGEAHGGGLGFASAFAGQKQGDGRRNGLFRSCQIGEQRTRHVRRIDQAE